MSDTRRKNERKRERWREIETWRDGSGVGKAAKLLNILR